jgi:hypothetical protein
LNAVRGYSQDELDEAFSQRDTDWEHSTTVSAKFMEVVKILNTIVAHPEADSSYPLYKTRLRNQADFYSLFAAIAMVFEDSLFRSQSLDLPAARLAKFIHTVEDEALRNLSGEATEYFTAARSNSNDTGSRRTRVRIVRDILQPVSQ